MAFTGGILFLLFFVAFIDLYLITLKGMVLLFVLYLAAASGGKDSGNLFCDSGKVERGWSRVTSHPLQALDNR